MASATAAVSAPDGENSTCARSVARLTFATVTPSTERIAFSTRPTQEAQVIPWTGMSMLSIGAGLAAVMVNLLILMWEQGVIFPIMGRSRGLTWIAEIWAGGT